MRIMRSLLVFVVGSFMLLAVSQGYAEDQEYALPSHGESTSEALVFGPPDTLGNDGFNPYVDVWSLKCAGKGEICAEVHDLGPNEDNTFHVITLCIKPKKKAEVAEMEIADADDAPNTQGDAQVISSSACVSNCKEARVIFTCEHHDYCDDAYDGHFECVGRPIKKLVRLWDMD